jgi:hypothetical protein
MRYDTAGDPVSGCKWTHKTTEKIAHQLRRAGIHVSPKTVAKLLKEMKFSLRVNVKRMESGSRKPLDPAVRDRQFRYIKRQRLSYAGQGLPVISIDSKCRELVGLFHRKGKSWCREAIEVFDHDFPSTAEGVGIPYGIYDTTRNEALVCLGTSYETSEFAVDSIRMWWRKVGRLHYPDAKEVLILADCGGGNGYRVRLWKYQLQKAFCNPLGLKAKICHYPPGTSKWNPIEHRVFPFISANWAGEPLISHEFMLKRIRTTETKTGLRVRACLIDKQYKKKIKISDGQMRQLTLKRYRVHPKWNYSICPA